MTDQGYLVTERDIRKFWKELSSYCEFHEAAFYFQIDGSTETFLGYRVRVNDIHYVDVYAVNINDAKAQPLHFFFKYEKTKILKGMKDRDGREIFVISEEPRQTSLELMDIYNTVDEIRTLPRVLVDDVEYFVIEMNEVARNGYTEISMKLLNKESGILKIHYTPAKRLWQKSKTDRDLYIDSGENL